MNLSFDTYVYIALFVIVAIAIFKSEIAAWLKRVKGTKGAQTVLADTDKAGSYLKTFETAVENALPKHSTPTPAEQPAVVPATTTVSVTTAPSPTVAADVAQATAAQDAIIAAAQAKKDAIAKAHLALQEAMK